MSGHRGHSRVLPRWHQWRRRTGRAEFGVDVAAGGGVAVRGDFGGGVGIGRSRECRLKLWERRALARRFFPTRQAGAWRSQGRSHHHARRGRRRRCISESHPKCHPSIFRKKRNKTRFLLKDRLNYKKVERVTKLRKQQCPSVFPSDL